MHFGLIGSNLKFHLGSLCAMLINYLIMSPKCQLGKLPAAATPYFPLCSLPRLTMPIISIQLRRKFTVNSQTSDDSSFLVMPPPPDLGGKSPRKSWNALALAFLGDSVWEVSLFLHIIPHLDSSHNTPIDG